MKKLLIILLLYMANAVSIEKNEKPVDLDSAIEKKFQSTLPLKLLCVPEVAGGLLFIKESNQWRPAVFAESRYNIFTAVITRVDKKDAMNCAQNAKIVTPYEMFLGGSLHRGILLDSYVETGKILCISISYMPSAPSVPPATPNIYEKACEVSTNRGITRLDCDNGNLLILPNEGVYFSSDLLDFGLVSGQMSITKGTCSVVPN